LLSKAPEYASELEVIIDLAKQGINEDIEYIYWVEWDDTPGIPVAITDNRIEPVED